MIITLGFCSLMDCGPWILRARIKKALTIVFTTSSKNMVATLEWKLDRNSNATEKSRVHELGLSGKPGLKRQVVSSCVNKLPSVHSDLTKRGLVKVMVDV